MDDALVKRESVLGERIASEIHSRYSIQLSYPFLPSAAESLTNPTPC